jgi:hypothetical protein
VAKRYWSCSCGERWPRIKQKCSCGKSRPKKRVPVHARTLRDDTYQVYLDIAQEVHGVTDESCCVCRKPRSQERRHDRDHDHLTGKPRGLACAGNRGCNSLMPSQLTLERARLIVAYLERVEQHYAVAA